MLNYLIDKGITIQEFITIKPEMSEEIDEFFIKVIRESSKNKNSISISNENDITNDNGISNNNGIDFDIDIDK